MRLPRTKHDELWLKACVMIIIEEMERPAEGPLARDIGLVEFAAYWADECAEVTWA